MVNGRLPERHPRRPWAEQPRRRRRSPGAM